jgi:hypothetical protein
MGNQYSKSDSVISLGPESEGCEEDIVFQATIPVDQAVDVSPDFLRIFNEEVLVSKSDLMQLNVSASDTPPTTEEMDSANTEFLEVFNEEMLVNKSSDLMQLNAELDHAAASHTHTTEEMDSANTEFLKVFNEEMLFLSSNQASAEVSKLLSSNKSPEEDSKSVASDFSGSYTTSGLDTSRDSEEDERFETCHEEKLTAPRQIFRALSVGTEEGDKCTIEVPDESEESRRETEDLDFVQEEDLSSNEATINTDDMESREHDLSQCDIDSDSEDGPIQNNFSNESTHDGLLPVVKMVVEPMDIENLPVAATQEDILPQNKSDIARLKEKFPYIANSVLESLVDIQFPLDLLKTKTAFDPETVIAKEPQSPIQFSEDERHLIPILKFEGGACLYSIESLVFSSPEHPIGDHCENTAPEDFTEILQKYCIPETPDVANFSKSPSASEY